MQFAPRRSVRSKHIVIAFTVAFAVFVTVVTVFTGRGFSLTMAVVSVLILLMILMEMSKFGWRYWVDEEGIGIKRTFKRYTIPAEEIDTVKSIGWRQAEKILKDARQSSSKMQAQVDFGRIIGFSSIPIPVPDSRSAPGKELRASKQSGAEIFVSVQRSDGRHYLLTPKDPKAFVKTCRNFGFGKRG